MLVVPHLQRMFHSHLKCPCIPDTCFGAQSLKAVLDLQHTSIKILLPTPPAPPYVYLDFKALNKHLLIYPEFRSAPPLHGFLLEFLLDPKTKRTAAEHFLHTTNLIFSLWCQSRGLLHLVWGFPACCAHLRLVLDEEHRHCLEL